MQTGDLYKRFIAGSERHPNYDETVNLAAKLIVHADGLVPDKLINGRRPSESEAIKDYRKKIYAAVTKNPINKVITSLGKIRRSADWSIGYDRENIPPVLGDSTLEDYCERHYPQFTSITNWVFTELLKRYLTDANGIYAVVPLRMPETAAEYISPMAYFFSSKNVIAYEPGEYAVLLSSETSRYTSPQGRYTYANGNVFYIITANEVVKYEQNASGAGGYAVTMSYEHALGYLPADKAGGLFLKRQNNDIIYESRIAVMTVSLDEAAREYSDLQAEVVQHIHSEKWQYATDDCPACKGTGLTRDTDGKPCTCPTCQGTTRTVNTSPFGVTTIAMQNRLSEYQLPAPPLGYVLRDVNIVRIQAERIWNHIYSALAAINMEFLAETPLNQSGTAKEVDRDELNNFVNGVAEDVVRIMDNIYRWICDLRYSFAVPDPEKRAALLPVINVPERYDLLSASHIMNEITALKTANANPLVISALEIDFVRKKFAADPEAADRLRAVLELDPLPGMSADDKMSYSAAGAIRETDYVTSANIVRFVARAFNEHRDFLKKTFDEKTAILEGYAKKIIDENSATAKVKELIIEN
jgi:hypothetical protein